MNKMEAWEKYHFDALFRVMDDIAEAMYMKGAADRELMIR